MIGTVFRTEDVPAGDRFDYWQELVGRTRSSALVSDHAADFWAEQRLLDRQAGTLQPSDAPRLGTVVLDLLSAWFAQLLEAEAVLAPETRGRATAERVQAFIRHHLHDPELTPP